MIGVVRKDENTGRVTGEYGVDGHDHVVSGDERNSDELGFAVKKALEERY